jgi:MFS family permease
LSRRPRRFDFARSVAVDISPLRESTGYRALWIGQILSLIGTQMRYVAVPFQVFDITHSNVYVGLIGLVEVVPLIVFSIIGGTVADMMDRRKVMAWSQVALMATSGALAALSLTGAASLVWVYLVVSISSAFSAIDRPARSAMLPQLVAQDQLSAAMALRQVVFQLTQIAGPLAAGLLIASFSVGWVYAIDALTFVAALASVRWVPAMPTPASGEQSGLQSIREGLRFSFRTPFILAIFLIDLVAMVFGMPRAVFPAVAAQTFHAGPSGLGMLYAAPSAGALLGALTTGWIKRIDRQGIAVIAAVTLWGGAVTAAGLSLFSFALTLLCLAIAGGADVVSAVFRGTMLLESTPDALRGRVSAVNLMVVTGGPRLGDVEAGLVAGALGAPASIVLGGALCLAGTTVAAGAFPPLRNYRARLATNRAGGQRSGS